MEYINIDQWPRKEHFAFFHQMDYPQFNICMNMDVTHFLEFVRENRISFYYALIFTATRAANDMVDFRYRIREDKIVLHDKVNPSFTDLSNDSDLFKYVTVDMSNDIVSFSKCAKEASETQKELFTKEATKNRDDLIYFTCIPWITFTSVTHPITLKKNDSIPRISWGKYFKQDGKVLLPFSIQVNHALLDGAQIGKYIDKLQNDINCL